MMPEAAAGFAQPQIPPSSNGESVFVRASFVSLTVTSVDEVNVVTQGPTASLPGFDIPERI
jgi:hypothetical protein